VLAILLTKQLLLKHLNEQVEPRTRYSLCTKIRRFCSSIQVSM